MNSITLCGHMGREPELTYTESGRPCCKFSIADQRPKDKDGNEVTQWFNCRAFDRVAELIHEYFSKGKPIWVSGMLHGRIYARQDGTAGLSLDVQVTSFDFVPFGNSQRKEHDPAEPTPPTPREAKPATSEGTGATASADAAPDVPNITDPFADQ